MALFSEYAVTPDVFNAACYKTPSSCGVYVRQLQEVFLSEGIVRDLRNSEWSTHLLDHTKPWHTHATKLLTALKANGRLVPIDSVLAHTPVNDRKWCKEALNSGINSIIVSNHTKNTYSRDRRVESVEKLSSSTRCTWWSPTVSSLRLERTINDYKDALKLILRYANYIMFIDPYIYPNDRYADFMKLLKAANNRPSESPVDIEIHTKIRNIPGKDREESLEKMKTTFQKSFAVPSPSKLNVKVFIWDDFHDRYLISNLVGIQMSNGFDTTTGPLKTIWSRIGRKDREDVERDFDATIRGVHPKCLFRFTIP